MKEQHLNCGCQENMSRLVQKDDISDIEKKALLQRTETHIPHT